MQILFDITGVLTGIFLFVTAYYLAILLLLKLINVIFRKHWSAKLLLSYSDFFEDLLSGKLFTKNKSK